MHKTLVNLSGISQRLLKSKIFFHYCPLLVCIRYRMYRYRTFPSSVCSLTKPIFSLFYLSLRGFQVSPLRYSIQVWTVSGRFVSYTSHKHRYRLEERLGTIRSHLHKPCATRSRVQGLVQGHLHPLHRASKTEASQSGIEPRSSCTAGEHSMQRAIRTALLTAIRNLGLYYYKSKTILKISKNRNILLVFGVFSYIGPQVYTFLSS